MLINCKNKMSTKQTGYGTLYAAYPCIINKASFFIYIHSKKQCLMLSGLIYGAKKYNECD